MNMFVLFTYGQIGFIKFVFLQKIYKSINDLILLLVLTKRKKSMRSNEELRLLLIVNIFVRLRMYIS